MGYIRKRGRRWAAEVRRAGQAQARTFSTKGEAQAWVVEVEGRIARGQAVGGEGRTFGDVLDKYLTDITPHKRGARNEAARLMAHLRDPIAQVRLAELAPRHFAELRDRRLREPSPALGRAVSGASVIRDFKLLSAALNVAVREWGWLAENPLTHVARPADNAPRGRVATAEEIERLRHVAAWPEGAVPVTETARTVAAFVLSCATGMRAGEILALERGWLRPRVAALPAHATKTGQAREVALSSAAQALIEQVATLGHAPAIWGLSDATRDALWRKVRNKAGLGPVRGADGRVVRQGLNFHDGRATFATWAAAPGPDGAPRLDVLALARQLGHRDIRQLMTYYRESTEALAGRLG